MITAAVFTALLLLGTTFPFSHESSAQDAAGEQTRRESEVCLMCHEAQQTNLVGGPHHLPASPRADARVACTDCHLGDPAHWEEDPETHPMTNPARQPFADVSGLCAQCHFSSHQQEMAADNPHACDDVGCLGCHQVHGAAVPGSLRQQEPGLCLGCHAEVDGEFAQPFRHPVRDGVMVCSECHLKLDHRDARLTFHGTGGVCFQCHMQFRGPFPHEHPATLDFSTEEGGCLNCHDPHGSPLPKMLNQPLDAPHFPLCHQCHFVPGHYFNSFHGDRWAGMACTLCHVDIHGSYTSPRFFGPHLQAQGCFVAGCHQP